MGIELAYLEGHDDFLLSVSTRITLCIIKVISWGGKSGGSSKTSADPKNRLGYVRAHVALIQSLIRSEAGMIWPRERTSSIHRESDPEALRHDFQNHFEFSSPR